MTGVTENTRTGEPGPIKGVKTRLFGVGLVFVGMLDSMLAWRGGLDHSVIPVALIAAGLFLCFIGVVRRGNRPPPPFPDHDPGQFRDRRGPLSSLSRVKATARLGLAACPEAVTTTDKGDDPWLP